jgi:Rrf2 family transcriptional regulator, cysteine metabolism repressor
MTVSQKCQYALRAIFELCRRQGQGPVKTAVIAQAQAIPVQFLELILTQLKQFGAVESRRGPQGGYLLACSPEQLTVGQIIRLIDGPIRPVKCIVGGGADCPMRGQCAFESMWTDAANAMSEVFDTTTFRDLLSRDRSSAKEPTHVFDI